MTANTIGAGTPRAPDAPSADGASRLPTADVFHLLQNSRRRSVVEYFMEHEGPVQLGTLADWVTACECETTPEAVSADARQRVYIALYQSHLPKLDSHDVVEYDSEQNLVARGTNAPALEAPLAFERATTRQGEDQPDSGSDRGLLPTAWMPYYLAISLGGFAALTAVWTMGLPSTIATVRVLSLVLATLYVLPLVGNVLWTRGTF